MKRHGLASGITLMDEDQKKRANQLLRQTQADSPVSPDITAKRGGSNARGVGLEIRNESYDAVG